MVESHDPELEELLRAQGGGSFVPGFADRVMRRIDAEPRGWLDSLALAPAPFVRVAAAATLVAAALAVFSLVEASGRSQTALEAVLGLEPLTAESIYDPNAFMPSAESTS